MTEKNKAAQEMAKLRHKKNPPSKEFMSKIGKKGMAKRWKKIKGVDKLRSLLSVN